MEEMMKVAVTLYLMKLPEVERVCALKKSQIYKLIKAHEFPAPISLGSKARAWRSTDIQTWIKNRPVAENFSQEVA